MRMVLGAVFVGFEVSSYVSMKAKTWPMESAEVLSVDFGFGSAYPDIVVVSIYGGLLYCKLWLYISLV